MLGIVRESLTGTSRCLRTVCAALPTHTGLWSCYLRLYPQGLDLAWWCVIAW